MVVDRVRLIAEMARKRMRISELMEKSGLSRPTIVAVRNGKTCSQETAAKLAAGLGVPVEEIMEKEGAK